jgi:hypothetical protein
MACCGFRRAVLVAATLLLLAVVQTAQASDWKFGEPRYVSPDGGSSECIGKLISARCAVESFLACHARADVDLCQMVTRRPRDEFTGKTLETFRIDYELQSFGRRKNNSGQFEHEIEIKRCFHNEDCSKIFAIYTYILLHDERGWWVRTWWSDDPS